MHLRKRFWGKCKDDFSLYYSKDLMVNWLAFLYFIKAHKLWRREFCIVTVFFFLMLSLRKGTALYTFYVSCSYVYLHVKLCKCETFWLSIEGRQHEHIVKHLVGYSKSQRNIENMHCNIQPRECDSHMLILAAVCSPEHSPIFQKRIADGALGIRRTQVQFTP